MSLNDSLLIPATEDFSSFDTEVTVEMHLKSYEEFSRLDFSAINRFIESLEKNVKIRYKYKYKVVIKT